MLSVYVSGASAELEQLEELAVRLRVSAGVNVLDRWMREVRALRREGKTDADLTPEHARVAAIGDLADIREADVLVFVVPTNASVGAWVELGYALARRPWGGTFILGDVRRSVFLAHPYALAVADESILVRMLRGIDARKRPARAS